MKQALLLLSLLLTISCTTETIIPRSEFYKTYEKSSILSKENLNGLTPQDAVIYGDSLYVLTRDSSNSSTVEIFQFSSGTHKGTLKSWQLSNGNADSLYAGMTISVFDSLLCIGSEKSRVDIFERSSLRYKSSIGDGNWWGDENTLIVHSFALALVNDHLVIRDKHHLRLYAVADLIEENRTKVPLQAKSIQLGSNSSKKRFGMVVESDFLYVTDYSNKSIERFSLSSLQSGDMEISPVDTLFPGSRPYDISSHDGVLFIPTDAKTVKMYNPETDEFSSLPSLEGHDFESPQTLLFHNDDFAVIETETESVVLGKVLYHKLAIYE